jgi:hypothetical protein
LSASIPVKHQTMSRDNQQNATVEFSTTSGNTFEIIIPEKEGMTVTVGIYFE